MEFLILESRELKWDAVSEERDGKGKVLKYATQARDEVLLTVRVDRQFNAKVALALTTATGLNRQQEIANTCAAVALGREVTQGVQVIEYERVFLRTTDAFTTPERRTERRITPGEEIVTIIPGEFMPAVQEQMLHIFTLRVDGHDIRKVTLTTLPTLLSDLRDALRAALVQAVTERFEG